MLVTRGQRERVGPVGARNPRPRARGGGVALALRLRPRRRRRLDVEDREVQHGTTQRGLAPPAARMPRELRRQQRVVDVERGGHPPVMVTLVVADTAPDASTRANGDGGYGNKLNVVFALLVAAFVVQRVRL
jgi:hypothetical protein